MIEGLPSPFEWWIDLVGSENGQLKIRIDLIVASDKHFVLFATDFQREHAVVADICDCQQLSAVIVQEEVRLRKA